MPSDSVLIYVRLFDISYSSSYDIFYDASLYTRRKCPSLITPSSPAKRSNVLLHKVLFELAQSGRFQAPLDVLKKLVIDYQLHTKDDEDLLRSFILIFHHQTWSCCSTELRLNNLFPVVQTFDDPYQRITSLKTLHLILLIYKDNGQFKQDTKFRQQLTQQLRALKTMNEEERTLRENIVSILL